MEGRDYYYAMNSPIANIISIKIVYLKKIFKTE